MATLTSGPYKLKRGTIPKPMQITLRGADGQPMDLSDVASLRFVMTLRSASIPSVDAEMTILQTTDENEQIVNQGQAEYAWAEGDLAVAGVYDGEFPFRFTGNATDRAPNDSYVQFEVVADLGG